MPKMIDMELRRIVLRDGGDRFPIIYLVERNGHRGFPIVIGKHEAHELYRVVSREPVGRPLTHQMALSIVDGLDSKVLRCDIVAMKNNTYFARLVLRSPSGSETEVEIDARPSDAIALALRAGATIRVVEEVLEEVRTDNQAPDPAPDEDAEDDPEGDSADAADDEPGE